MAENPVEKAVRESEISCQQAVASTPEAYRQFVIFISQNKRVAGTKSNPIFANIRSPYMAVDGRVKMALDEHREQGASLSIKTTFEEILGVPVCRCEATSDMHGSRTATAKVFFDGIGADSTNPLENAETSAVGRALGFMGYGLYGNGIASAEEVLGAMDEQSSNRVQESSNTPISPTNPTASNKQLGFLYSLLTDAGIQEGNKRAFINHIYPEGIGKANCSNVIEVMKNEKRLPDGWQSKYIGFLVQSHGLDRIKIAGDMDVTYGHHNPDKLSQEDFEDLVAKVGEMNEPDDIPDTPSDVYTPGENYNVSDIVAFAKEVGDHCKVSSGTVAAWALGKFPSLEINSMSRLPKSAYDTLRAMDMDAIEKEVKAVAAKELLSGKPEPVSAA